MNKFIIALVLPLLLMAGPIGLDNKGSPDGITLVALQQSCITIVAEQEKPVNCLEVSAFSAVEIALTESYSNSKEHVTTSPVMDQMMTRFETGVNDESAGADRTICSSSATPNIYILNSWNLTLSMHSDQMLV